VLGWFLFNFFRAISLIKTLLLVLDPRRVKYSVRHIVPPKPVFRHSGSSVRLPSGFGTALCLLHVGFTNTIPALEFILAFEPNSEILFGSNALANHFFRPLLLDLESGSDAHPNDSPTATGSRDSCYSSFAVHCLISRHFLPARSSMSFPLVRPHKPASTSAEPNQDQKYCHCKPTCDKLISARTRRDHYSKVPRESIRPSVSPIPRPSLDSDDEMQLSTSHSPSPSENPPHDFLVTRHTP
jgi:hypothetical protein